MGSCYSGDYNAGDCTYGHKQRYHKSIALERSVIDYWGLDMFTGFEPLPFASVVV